MGEDSPRFYAFSPMRACGDRPTVVPCTASAPTLLATAMVSAIMLALVLLAGSAIAQPAPRAIDVSLSEATACHNLAGDRARRLHRRRQGPALRRRGRRHSSGVAGERASPRAMPTPPGSPTSTARPPAPRPPAAWSTCAAMRSGRRARAHRRWHPRAHPHPRPQRRASRSRPRPRCPAQPDPPRPRRSRLVSSTGVPARVELLTAETVISVVPRRSDRRWPQGVPARSRRLRHPLRLAPLAGRRHNRRGCSRRV